MKQSLLLAAALLGGVLCGALQAQAFPSRQVRIIVPYPAGGGIDILARQMGQKLSAQWSQPVVIENRPGSSTILATELAAKAPADGHTILLTTDSTFSINPHLFAKLPYQASDFAPVTMLVLLHQLLVAHPSLPANTLPDLIALARATPGKYNYASYGSGSQPHLSGEMLKAKAGIDLVHIPYKGISLAIPAAIAGEVHMTFSGIASSIGHLKGGRLKALAIGGPKRSPLLPDVLTFTELGYPEVETHAWFGLLVPSATPQAAIERIHGDAVAIVNEPEFLKKEIIGKGYELVANLPGEFAAFMKKDSENRGRAVKISGARAD